MPLATHSITCTSKRLMARDVYELEFTKPVGFSFTAGQYVLIDVPLIENPMDLQTRAFSIASAPSENALLFAMKMKKGGRASRWIEEVVNAGTEATMKGPFGRFVLDTKSQKDILMVATSTGIVPFLSILRAMLGHPIPVRIDLVFGVFSEQDLFWQKELEDLARQLGNVYLHLALSDPSPSWKGHRGWVQSLIPKIVTDFSNRKLYICGNPAMTADVKKLALGEWGVGKEDVHMEGYI